MFQGIARQIFPPVRRAARRAGLGAAGALCALIGAGFLSASAFAALIAAGQSVAMAALILGCLWFGLSGVFLLIRNAAVEGGSASHERSSDGSATAGAHAAGSGGASVSDVMMAAFMAGLSEGSGFARARGDSRADVRG